MTRGWLTLLFSLGAMLAPQVTPPSPASGPVATPERPNVVFVIADDLGCGDLSCYGNAEWKTPALDAVAREGVRFTVAYSAAPLCTPSRAALLTGRSPARIGVEFNIDLVRSEFGLPVEVPTLAELLKTAGYATGLIGKWHLGGRSVHLPSNRGFDEFFGFLGSSSSYDPKIRAAKSNLWLGLKPHPVDGWLTKEFASAAADFVKRHATEPFFLCLALSAPHLPMQPDPALNRRLVRVHPQKRRVYANLVLGIDDAMGALDAALREHGVFERTLVVFCSDHGSIHAESNGGLRGAKFSVHDGGLRIPLIVRWPGRVPAGAVEARTVSTLDLVPTALAAARIPVAPAAALEGVDLVAALAQPNRPPLHDALFWRFGPLRAVRSGDWKLVDSGDGARTLFDLAHDPAEQLDLASGRPEKLAELWSAWTAWDAGNVVPLWPMAHADRFGEEEGDNAGDEASDEASGAAGDE